MLEYIKKDYYRINLLNDLSKKATVCTIFGRAIRDSGFRSVCLYRIGRWFCKKRMRILAAFTERVMRHLCHCSISSLADIGPGFVIAHTWGIIVPAGAVLGENCDIRQNVTIGGNYGKKDQSGRSKPCIGSDVSIGAGAVVLGPINVGSNCILGANSVITKDVPDNSVVGSFRAEVLAKRDEDGQIKHFDERIFLSRKELYERLKMLENRVIELENTLKE